MSMTLAVMHAYQAAASALAEAEYVKTLTEDQQASYWASKAERAEINRRERSVSALEAIARQGRYQGCHVSPGFELLLGIALGGTL